MIITFRSTVDEWLPKAILDGVQSILILSGSIVITATVNPYFLIPFSVIGVIFIYIRKIYLKTSKNIKRIEGIGKSHNMRYSLVIQSQLIFFRIDFCSKIPHIYAFGSNFRWPKHGACFQR